MTRGQMTKKWTLGKNIIVEKTHVTPSRDQGRYAQKTATDKQPIS
jgi:hypothetical protein